MPTFKHVLMLVMGLAAPQANPEEVEAIDEFGAGVVAGVITKKSIWGSPRFRMNDWNAQRRDLEREMGLMWTMWEQQPKKI